MNKRRNNIEPSAETPVTKAARQFKDISISDQKQQEENNTQNRQNQKNNQNRQQNKPQQNQQQKQWVEKKAVEKKEDEKMEVEKIEVEKKEAEKKEVEKQEMENKTGDRKKGENKKGGRKGGERKWAEKEKMEVEKIEAEKKGDEKKEGEREGEKKEEKKGEKERENAHVLEGHLTNTPFPSTLACSKAISKHWKYMSKIQELSLPHLLQGKDLLAQAKTGSGKTLAFMVPAVELAAKNVGSNDILVLVLAPVRELALQTVETGRKLAAGLNIGIQLVIGGTNENTEANRLKKEKKHIVVATPLRLIAHIQEGTINLNNVQLFVLDEVDHLLGMGFYPQTKTIRSFLPKAKGFQTALFSATIDERVKELGEMRPGHISVSTIVESEDITNTTLTQQYAVVDPKNYAGALVALLKESTKIPGEGTLVFCPTAAVADYLQRFATANGFPCSQMTGKSNQKDRFESFNSMRDKGGLVFASSLLARGVDISTIRTVVQLFPCQVEEYVHKAGRTGRMGKEGRSIIVLTQTEANAFLPLMKQKFHISPTKIHLAPEKAVLPTLINTNSSGVAPTTPGTATQIVRKKALRTLLCYMTGLPLKYFSLDLDAIVEYSKCLFGLEDPSCISRKALGKIPRACKQQIEDYSKRIINLIAPDDRQQQGKKKEKREEEKNTEEKRTANEEKKNEEKMDGEQKEAGKKKNRHRNKNRKGPASQVQNDAGTSAGK